jgi:predicted enzyme related to lactoylglutathione lyase
MNTITHIEIPAPDLGVAVSFYSKVFKWKVQVMQPDMYAFFIISEDADGKGRSGGGLDAALKPADERTGVQIVIDVDDIETALDKIEKHGGEVVALKTEIEGGHGFYASFRDPNGNYLQIHSRK